MSLSSVESVEAVGTTNIPVRRMDFKFDDSIPKYWYGDDPIRTMVLTALSCTFPEGERMFMRAVRHFQANITDPKLQKDVRAFIGQEAHHGKEHQAFNEMMGRKNLPTMNIDKFVKKMIAREESLFSPEHMLARTCALEHFTAMFAEMLLAHPEMLNEVDERLKPLWMWHAVEESEHKSVAFDVFQDQVNSYWIRSGEMAFISVFFTFFTIVHTRQLLSAAKSEVDTAKSMRKNLAMLWKNRRVLADLSKHYLSYYRPNFHPSQKDSSSLRKKGLLFLKKYVGDKVALAA